ncbi:hypothetical protein TKK_0007644 [Trichogramma kaykai]
MAVLPIKYSFFLLAIVLLCEIVQMSFAMEASNNERVDCGYACLRRKIFKRDVNPPPGPPYCKDKYHQYDNITGECYYVAWADKRNKKN